MSVRNEETRCVAFRNVSTCIHSLYVGEGEDVQEFEKILWIFEDDLEEKMYFDDLEDCQLPQPLNPSRNSQTLWGQLVELPHAYVTYQYLFLL